MRNYVIINGVNSLTIQGLAINNLPPITKPMIRTQREEIDGRDGDIVTELGYSAYDKQIEIGLWGTYDINDIIKYFTGEGTIVFSNEEDKYYNFKILDQIDYEKLLKFKTATITLHCQPFKYPLEEEPVEAEITTLTGTGTTLTLNNTEEAPMSLVYKGNTYQDSTTGKNLFDESIMPTNTMNGIKWEYTNNKIKISGTSTGTYSQSGNISITLQAGTYFFVKSGTTNLNFNAWFYNTGGTLIANSKLNNPFTISENATRIVLFVEGITSGTSYNQEMNFMVSTTNGEYEPYTNGASPNPDYPQDIHVVSGDNSIVVCGKNLFDKDNANIYNGYFTVNSPTITSSSSHRTIYIPIEPNTTYTIQKSNAGGNDSRFAIGTTTTIPTTSVSVNQVQLDFTATHMTITTNAGSKYLVVWCYFTNNTAITFENVLSTIQIEEGTTATTYEAYTGESYSISLGVENLLNITATSTTISGITYTVNSDKSIVANGTATAHSVLNLSGNLTLKAGTYTWSGCPANGSWATYSMGFGSYNDSGTGATFTKTEDYTAQPYIRIGNGTTVNNLVFKPQIVKGSTPSRITDNPIELLKIGTYQDKIDKSSGKNLFNYDYISNYSNTTFSSYRYIKINGYDKNKRYLMSGIDTSNFDNLTGVTVVLFNAPAYSGLISGSSICYNSNHFSTNKKVIDTNLSTTGELYLGFYTSNSVSQAEYEKIVSKLKLVQLEEMASGDTPTSYEPYGTGWYVKKEIGKVVLDGSEEGWAYSSNNTNFNIRAYYLGMKSSTTSAGYIPKVCNYFKYYASNGNTPNLADGIYENTNNTQISFLLFHCDSLNITTLESWKTWLSTNKPIIYYVLETPTYTLIEDSTLIEELESMKKSKEGQTNISQENNDLPFELDVSVTFLTPMEINNIGNIYAKPILTIEGTGNIGVVLNGIQILDIDLTNNGKIAIDVPKLEAYNPDDDTLLNRLVTGDYMKLLINEGENTITFTGNVSGATLTNYIRWI